MKELDGKDYVEDGTKIEDVILDEEDYYKGYYSTLDSYENYSGFSLKASSKIKMTGPSISEKIMDQLRHIVFNDYQLLESTFDDPALCKEFFDAKFAKYF